MSSINFKNLTSEFPNDAEAIIRLNSFLSQKSDEKNAKLLSFGVSRIYEIAKPSSKSTLEMILSRLVEIGALREVFRVNSKDGSGIEEFPDFNTIPSVIYDNITGTEMEISLEDVSLYYKIAI